MAATEIAQGSEGAVKRWAGGSKMPAKARAIGGGRYQVSTPNAVHAKSATKPNAEAQVRLLNAVDHGWKPTGKIGGKGRMKR